MLDPDPNPFHMNCWIRIRKEQIRIRNPILGYSIGTIKAEKSRGFSEVYMEGTG
jgi:hypothetical protein